MEDTQNDLLTQEAGTHFADLGGTTGGVNPSNVISTARQGLKLKTLRS